MRARGVRVGDALAALGVELLALRRPGRRRLLASRIGEHELPPADALEGLPLPFGLREALADGKENGGVEAEAEMAATTSMFSDRPLSATTLHRQGTISSLRL